MDGNNFTNNTGDFFNNDSYGQPSHLFRLIYDLPDPDNDISLNSFILLKTDSTQELAFLTLYQIRMIKRKITLSLRNQNLDDLFLNK